MSNLKIYVLSLIFLLGFGFLLSGAIEAKEKAECELWRTQSELYAGYYFTSWQIEQCEAVNMSLGD